MGIYSLYFMYDRHVNIISCYYLSHVIAAHGLRLLLGAPVKI